MKVAGSTPVAGTIKETDMTPTITEIKPLKTTAENSKSNNTIFLAGSIDMGAAINWQERAIQYLRANAKRDYVVFNPRRDDWDSTWEQSIDNEKFRDQVEWELEHITRADFVVFYFDPNGPAPITLLELGLVATSGQSIFVCCPRGYWRKGNVDVVCMTYDIPVFESLEEMLSIFAG